MTGQQMEGTLDLVKLNVARPQPAVVTEMKH